MNWLDEKVAAGRTSFNNRVIMAPMTRRRSPGGIPSEDVIDYYRRRIDGGVGGIITEGMLIEPLYAGFEPAVPTLDTREGVSKWRDLNAYARSKHVPVLAQLWHQGTYSKNGSGYYRLSPSGMSVDQNKESRAMTRSDIARTVGDYADAAARAIENGFAGVELHGAHGYLLDSFIWHKSNLRDDEYGGYDIRSRMRLPSEVVQAVREAVGSERTISYRFSQWKTNLWSARNFDSPLELERGVTSLVDAGVDILHVSTRRWWVPAFPELSGRDGHRTLPGWVKKITGIPTIAVGSIGIPTIVDGKVNEYSDEDLRAHVRLLNEEDIDLIGVGRALLSDAEWAKHACAKGLAEVKPYSPNDKETLL